MIIIFFFLIFVPLRIDADNCQAKQLDGWESHVCVCTKSYCPSIRTWTNKIRTQAHTYTSSLDGLRLKENTVAVYGPSSSSSSSSSSGSSSSSSSSSSNSSVVEIACQSPQQMIKGFGGALTDSTSIVISSLSPAMRDALMSLYFSQMGIEYGMIRIPIAGTDFSTRPYTYDDEEGDLALEQFRLALEDTEYKLPLVHQAMKISNRQLKILASPWTAPAWMKTSGKLNGTGELKREMWQPWTDYLIRFIKQYEESGVSLWALTSQNHAFTFKHVAWNAMQWQPSDMRDWIKESLGPSLSQAGYGYLKLYVGDDTRDNIDSFSREILHDPAASRFITGIAVHWYADEKTDPKILDRMKFLFPEQDILYTEACNEATVLDPLNPVMLLGSWTKAEKYAENIIEAMQHGVSGWLDWNLALDLTGGPNWANGEVDAPIIVNAELDEFYVQPMFFSMAHFSKFVPSGSEFLPCWLRGVSAFSTIHCAAFMHADGYVVLILLNKDEIAAEVRVEWEAGMNLQTSLPSRSIQTLVIPWDGNEKHNREKYWEENH